MKKRVFSALMAAALTASMVFGTVAASAEEKSNEDITIGISMCAIESQMWAEYQSTMHATCDEMGVKYTEVIAENDTQKQNQKRIRGCMEKAETTGKPRICRKEFGSLRKQPPY